MRSCCRKVPPSNCANSGVLWNAAEAAEKRRDAQVAREVVLALPADATITSEDRIELARSFADEHFVAKGLAVQFDAHAPHEGVAESEHANWHAHLLITTRRLEGGGFAVKKARDLDPEIRRAGRLPVVAEQLFRSFFSVSRRFSPARRSAGRSPTLAGSS